MTEKEMKLIEAMPLFAGLPDCAAALCAAGEERDYARGEVIFDAESFRRALGIVLSGLVRVTKSVSGSGELVMSALQPGAIFGAAAIFGQAETFPSILTALEPTRALFIGEGELSAAMAAQPRLAENYIRYLTGRIEFLNRRIVTLTAGTAEQRLAGYLAENLPEGERASLPLSMTQLAKFLNISRASLYRALDALEAAGAIRREGAGIFLISRKICYEV